MGDGKVFTLDMADCSGMLAISTACAFRMNKANGLPRYRDVAGAKPTPESLAWDPYDTKRKRWFRTANDSLRTHTRKDLPKSIAGSFHPTGAGHAAMADAAYLELSKLFVDKQR